ncbi:MAG: hypothetical protein DRP60_03090 [Spirochaetes bacterium]|nr:MAG: hypothetical protein DRP60_03090 [Spirochaetota bacterium]
MYLGHVVALSRVVLEEQTSEVAEVVDRLLSRILRDESRSMDIRQIAHLPDAAWESSDNDLYFGYTGDFIWLRFPLEAAGSSHHFLTEHHGIDQFDVWLLEDDSSNPVLIGSTGWSVMGERQNIRENQAFSTVLVPSVKDSPSTLFIRVRSTSSISLTLILFDSTGFQRSLRATNIVQGIGLGSSLMMVVFALIIMVSSRRLEFVYFFILVLATTLLGLYLGGFGPLYLWKNYPNFTIIVGLSSAPLMTIIIVRFFRSILNLEDFPGYSKWLFSSELLMYLVLIVINLVPKTLGFQISSYVNLVIILYLQALLITGVFLRMRYSKYLLTAWSMTMIAGLYQMLLNLGLLPFIPDIYNTGFLIMFAFLIQNAILGGTIVVQSEMSIVDERLLRINAERQVKDARERLIQTDRMTGLASMVSTVAHEIATPVGNAKMLGSEIEVRARRLAELSSRGEPDKVGSEEFLEFAGDSGVLIVQTLSHAGGMMEGFKVVAADKATLKEKSIEPQEYFARIERILSPKIRRSRHELKVVVEAEGSLQTIPGYITQVVDNLVNNAMKHAFPEGVRGNIGIEVQNDADNGLEISVSDDGAGIPEDVLPHIFDMFYTTSGEEGGTGLGLAISKTLAEEQLKGSLECFTEKDKRTRFVFRIADLSRSK